jgi:predicted RNase H-like nuclease
MEVSLVGVDGCRDGWVVATSADSGSIHFRIVQDIAALFALDIVAAIDVPIGLLDAGSNT